MSVYTRSLDDITARLPEVVDATLALPVTTLIADAEAIALRPDGRPHRFQVTASRFGRTADVEGARATQPLSVFFFDLLHLDGADLLDLPTSERLAALDSVVPAGQRVDRLATADGEAAAAFLAATLAAGHEGVMAKSPTAPYEAGRRGAGWLKVKPVHTLDLVVLAVEWGSGRRTGKLSNIHLGARDAERWFRDAWQDVQGHDRRDAGVADRPLPRTRGRPHRRLRFDCRLRQRVVHLRPEQVVEIALDGVQTSTRYPGGMALRFARVLRYRDDKGPAEADTVERVRTLYES